MSPEDRQAQLVATEKAVQEGNYADAEKLALELLSVTDPLIEGERADHASALLHLGSIARQRGNPALALEHIREALNISEQSGDKLGIAKALGNIGIVYTILSDYPRALEAHNQALQINEELGNKTGVATNIGNIGIVYLNLADYSKALEYLTHSLSLNLEFGNKTGVASNHFYIGRVYSSLADYQKALESYTQSLSLSEELGYRAGFAAVLGNIGGVYMNMSDYSKALEYLAQALSLDEELGNKSGIANRYATIGEVQMYLSNYPNALEYFTLALNLNQEIDDKGGAASNLDSIGNAYYYLSDLPKALDYYSQALRIDEELGKRDGVARHLSNMGNIFAKQADFEHSLECISRALHMYEELGKKWETAVVKANIGDLLSNAAWQGRDEAKAETYLLESISMSHELGMKIYHPHHTLAELYERQERWKESQMHFKLFYEIKDEVQSQKAKDTAVLMEKRRNITERENAIAIAKATAEAKMSATTTLLYKVLPESVATRMIDGEEKIADYFSSVTILFADIVGFTPIASRMPAKAVLMFLNYVFSEFDRMAERHGCEKIKTIGDGYLAVAGAPIACDDHAERITRLAIDMMGDIVLPEEIRKTLPKGAQFNLRIGIHTGPCFGGIVGENRFVYDIYSDAVNLAARMESHGEPGKIHVSDEFCFHLQNRIDSTGEDLGGIRFEEREEMEIKGKGKMRTYFLERT